MATSEPALTHAKLPFVIAMGAHLWLFDVTVAKLYSPWHLRGLLSLKE